MNELMTQGHEVSWTIQNGKKVWFVDGVIQEMKNKVKKTRKNGRREDN